MCIVYIHTCTHGCRNLNSRGKLQLRCFFHHRNPPHSMVGNGDGTRPTSKCSASASITLSFVRWHFVNIFVIPVWIHKYKYSNKGLLLRSIFWGQVFWNSSRVQGLPRWGCLWSTKRQHFMFVGNNGSFDIINIWWLWKRLYHPTRTSCSWSCDINERSPPTWFSFWWWSQNEEVATPLKKSLSSHSSEVRSVHSCSCKYVELKTRIQNLHFWDAATRVPLNWKFQ